LSKVKATAELSAGECQRVTLECQQLREQLTHQQCHSQKLCDHMHRITQKCQTDEQVSAVLFTRWLS